MAKDSTNPPPSAPRPPGQRPAPIIDLPAAEVSRTVRSDAPPSAAGAAGETAKPTGHDAPPVAKPAAGTRRDENRVPPKAATAPAEEPVIPSAFATGNRTRVAREATAPAGRSFAFLLLAAVAGGILAAAAVLLLGPYLDAANNAPDLSAEVATLQRDVEALKQAEPAAPDATLDGRIAALEQALVELRAQPAAAGTDAATLAEFETRLAALEQGGGEAPAAGVDPALLSRTDAIENTLSGVGEQVAAIGEQVTALQAGATTLAEQAGTLQSSLDATRADVETAVALGPAVMADALSDALRSGEPFAAELAAMRGLAFDAAALDGLAPHAEAGLPTLAALRADFETAAASIDLTPPPPEGTGTVDRLLQSARGLVEVRPANPVEGTDPPAVLARIRGALDAGDLGTALDEWNALPDDAKAATQEWADTARARLAADEFAARLRADALSRLGGQG